MPTRHVYRRHMDRTPNHRTNAEIAAVTGLHYSAVSRIRKGNRCPEWETMRAINRAYPFTNKQLAEWTKAILNDGAAGSARFLATNLP
jgi:hypothetical protein